MSVSENLKVAIQSRNIDDIRGGLWSCIAVDMNMTGRFKESLDYILANGISEEELFEDDDGQPFETEATKDNFSELGGLLRVNFSKKKLDALRVMGCVLYPPKVASEEPKKNQAINTKSVYRQTYQSDERKKAASNNTAEQRRAIEVCAGGGAVLCSFTAAKCGAKIGGIIGGGIIGACIGAAIGYALFRDK